MIPNSPAPEPVFRLHRGDVNDLDDEVRDMVRKLDGQLSEESEPVEPWDDDDDVPARRGRWKWIAVGLVAAILVCVATYAATGGDPIGLIDRLISGAPAPSE